MHLFDDAFLAGQQAYYDARAAEYNEWWDRKGRYDHGPEANARWFREREEVYAALEALDPGGHVLELACGTGNWTLPLSRKAQRVTAVDGSAEMIAINQAVVRSERVRYVQADLFAWEPDQAYDAAVMGFWLSHVPPERLDSFLATVCRALRPGGKLFFADSRRDPLITSADQPLPEAEQPWLARRLNDGREFRIVKVFYHAQELAARFEAHGLRVEVRETATFFLYGSGVRTKG